MTFISVSEREGLDTSSVDASKDFDTSKDSVQSRSKIESKSALCHWLSLELDSSSLLLQLLLLLSFEQDDQPLLESNWLREKALALSLFNALSPSLFPPSCLSFGAITFSCASAR